jgi:hypothetical protein
MLLVKLSALSEKSHPFKLIPELLLELMTHKYPKYYKNLALEDFACDDEPIYEYTSLIPLPEEKDENPQPCYAVDDFYKTGPRYDKIQISWDEDTKLYALLWKCFSYTDIRSR